MPNIKYKTKRQREKAHFRAVTKWQKTNTRCINVRYHLVNDKDILDKLDSVDNKGDYKRQLIRKDLEENKA